MKRQRITILGSTGSIGVNTLDVISRHPDQFEIFALTAHRQVDKLLQQCRQWRPSVAVVVDTQCAQALAQALHAEGLKTEVLTGAPALTTVAAEAQVDIVMAAIVGAAGLAPCMAAARSGKRLLLANKEALVVGGQVFLQAVQAGGATLLPIDSEHSAIFQSLPADRGTWSRRLDKLILTASGGPFLHRDPDTFQTITPDEACAHPNWKMGRKISVDSATMMNKALEVIEAHYLFGVAPQDIEVLIHPQSVIHSMVQYRDHSVVAQLGGADMRVPIAYGLSWPERMASGAGSLDFPGLAGLDFQAWDSAENKRRFPGLPLAWQALAATPGTCAILNAANEEAVAAFLSGRIRFDQIHAVNRDVLERIQSTGPADIEGLLALDAQGRRAARAWIDAV